MMFPFARSHSKFIAADALREYLPEYVSYQESDSRDVAEMLTRKETGYIVETLIRATLERGRNVVYYCGLLDGKWFRRVFLPELKRKYAARVSGCHHPHAKHPVDFQSLCEVW